MKVENFKKAIRECGQKPAIIHMRIGTSGRINEKFTHPFGLLGGTIALAHNGILSHLGNKDESDTFQFAKMLDAILKLSDRKEIEPELLSWVTQTVGKYNKIAFINSKGLIKIANEAEGKWIDGSWYSNESHEEWYAAYFNRYAGSAYECNASKWYGNGKAYSGYHRDDTWSDDKTWWDEEEWKPDKTGKVKHSSRWEWNNQQQKYTKVLDEEEEAIAVEEEIKALLEMTPP